MPKELFNHYTIISTDAAGNYTQAAYAAAFPREIDDILAVFDKWVAGKRPAAALAPAPSPVHDTLHSLDPLDSHSTRSCPVLGASMERSDDLPCWDMQRAGCRPWEQATMLTPDWHLCSALCLPSVGQTWQRWMRRTRT